MKLLRLATMAVLGMATLASARETPGLKTLAESSGWIKTGRYAEVVRLCHGFARAYPGRVACRKFGVTPEGRDMLALVASEAGALTPEASKGKQLPVLLAQGAIHAGECDGKDAGLYLLREILERRVLPGVLKKLTFVFVPVFNVDGHERFGPHNRPNQVGPEEMGWRVTASNLNLNRDYAKAEAPEMQAMLGLLGAWDPILYADLHVTDGAKFQHDIAVIVQPRLAGPEELRSDAAALSAAVMARLKERGHLPLPFYPDFKTYDDPSTGFESGMSPPRYSDAYWGWRNRLGVLVETHSWKDYGARVRATIDALSILLEATAREGRHWRDSAREADEQAASVGGKPAALAYAATEKSRPIEFLGYDYTREMSKISGQLMTSYDASKPKTFHLPLYDELKPKLSVTAPVRGYYVPPVHAPWVASKLKLHGISFERLKQARSGDIQAFRCSDPRFDSKSFEGRHRLEVKGEWKVEKQEIPAGSLFVPIAQPRSRLAMQLLEPQAPDSLASWGFFNTAFERKEYMEAYVAEEVAREMLARDPAIKIEFEKKLASEPEFAKDADQRLEFFYRKHPSWDDRFGLYPVFRE